MSCKARSLECRSDCSRSALQALRISAVKVNIELPFSQHHSIVKLCCCCRVDCPKCNEMIRIYLRRCALQIDRIAQRLKRIDQCSFHFLGNPSNISLSAASCSFLIFGRAFFFALPIKPFPSTKPRSAPPSVYLCGVP